MKYKAIIFDLFGTLIKNLPEGEYRRILRKVADALSVEPEYFIKLWLGHFSDLMSGARSNTDCLNLVSRKMGADPTDDMIDTACGILIEEVGHMLLPSAEMLAAVSDLCAGDLTIGILSNCSDEVPIGWKSSPLSAYIPAPVFSCSSGMKKPDMRIYLLAAAQLGVEPEECLFIDDNPEFLAGAVSAGMTPILVRDEKLFSASIGQDGWKGLAVSSILELAELVKNLERG